MEQKSGIQRAVDVHGGSASKLAFAIGGNVIRQHVEYWLKTGRVPAEHCPAIEQATGGLVTCEELRPDVLWSVIRGNPAIDLATIDQPAAEAAATQAQDEVAASQPDALGSMLRKQHDRAAEALSANPDDRMAKLVKDNRAQALQDLAPVIHTTDTGALRSGAERRAKAVNRRAEEVNRRAEEAAAKRDRRAKGGPPFQSLETGVA